MMSLQGEGLHCHTMFSLSAVLSNLITVGQLSNCFGL